MNTAVCASPVPRSSPAPISTPSPSWDVEIPLWLNSCLLRQQDENGFQLVEETHTSETHTKETHTKDDRLICKAFQFAYSLHQGQSRVSGDPYIAHPVAVAGILRDFGGSAAMIAAGFLHDVVEDTDVTIGEIEEHFGKEVASLVEGVTKLSKLNFSSKTARQAENFRRMFLAMAKDIRVIVVKLSDRLHNMRTLEHLSPEKRVLIALETREIFAPLANRLGMGQIKWELEDLAFKYLEPGSFQEIKALVADKRIDREERINSAIQRLKERLAKIGITPVEISGRPKHLYSIYCKMETQNKQFHEIYDVAAIRIITQTHDECYRSLAVVHDVFRPIPGRFKDYIGLPKANHYQSLHTTVMGSAGRPMEVQIRTQDMHRVAEYGIAAHWKYKESGGSIASVTPSDEKFSWLRQLVDWQSDLKDDQEYLDNIKNNLFDEDVYVFTPQGDVIALARNATPVDFAYRIHTEVGNHCCGAKLNDRLVPLDTLLKNGDIVEILCQKNAHPSLDWINFVVSSSAKNRIRQWFKRLHRDENIILGREMLEKELGKTGLETILKSQPMQTVVERCNYTTVEDLLAGVGYGETSAKLVVNRLRELIRQATLSPLTDEEVLRNLAATQRPAPAPHPSSDPIVGIEGLVYRVAGCCSPLPGEPIIAAISLGGHGLSVHRQGCHNVDTVPGDRLIPVSWNGQEKKGRVMTYPVRLRVEVIDRVGVLRDVLSRLMDHSINVNNANVKTAENKPALIELCVDIANHDQLCRLSCQLKKMSDVLSVSRLGTEIK